MCLGSQLSHPVQLLQFLFPLVNTWDCGNSLDHLGKNNRTLHLQEINCCSPSPFKIHVCKCVCTHAQLLGDSWKMRKSCFLCDLKRCLWSSINKYNWLSLLRQNHEDRVSKSSMQSIQRASLQMASENCGSISVFSRCVLQHISLQSRRGHKAGPV